MTGARLRSRFLALAILVGLVAAAGVATFSLYGAYAANRDAIMEKRAMLARVNGVIAQSARVDQWIGQLSQGLDEGVFLAGSGDAVSSAELQARLVDIAARSGAVLGSFRPMEPQALEGLVDIGVEIALQGDLRSVHQTIATIEGSLPLLFLEKAQFRVTQDEASPDAEPMLEVQLEIHGYARAAGAETSGT